MGIAIRDWNPSDCLVSRRANGEAKGLSNLATEILGRSKIQIQSNNLTDRFIEISDNIASIVLLQNSTWNGITVECFGFRMSFPRQSLSDDKVP